MAGYEWFIFPLLIGVGMCIAWLTLEAMLESHESAEGDDAHLQDLYTGDLAEIEIMLGNPWGPMLMTMTWPAHTPPTAQPLLDERFHPADPQLLAQPEVALVPIGGGA